MDRAPGLTYWWGWIYTTRENNPHPSSGPALAAHLPSQYTSRLFYYQGLGEYSMNGPVEIRVTGLDQCHGLQLDQRWWPAFRAGVIVRVSGYGALWLWVWPGCRSRAGGRFLARLFGQGTVPHQSATTVSPVTK
jgi:Cholesterol oxidase, substrate-binding